VVVEVVYSGESKQATSARSREKCRHTDGVSMIASITDDAYSASNCTDGVPFDERISDGCDLARELRFRIHPTG
jgi:hypothetical protein